jgi:hypothetical protein
MEPRRIDMKQVAAVRAARPETADKREAATIEAFEPHHFPADSAAAQWCSWHGVGCERQVTSTVETPLGRFSACAVAVGAIRRRYRTA